MKLLSIILLVLGFVLTSCKTSFRISVKTPAKVRIDGSVKSYGVINNVDQENSPEKKIAGIILGTESINGNVEAAERAVDGSLRGLENSGYLSGKTVSDEVKIHQENGDVDWEALEKIAGEKNVDGFIELTKLETLSPVGGNVLANAAGKRSARLEGTMYVNYYVPSTKQKYERYKVFYVYNIPLSGSTSVIDLLGDAQRKEEYYKALGFQLGYKAGSQISPNWIWVGRSYYTR